LLKATTKKRKKLAVTQRIIVQNTDKRSRSTIAWSNTWKYTAIDVSSAHSHGCTCARRKGRSVAAAAKRDERGTKVATPGLDASLLAVWGSAA